MDICQIHKYYHPHVGGIEGHVQRLAEGLTAAGNDVSVVTSTPFGFGATDSLDGVDICRTGSLGELFSVPLAPTFPVQTRRHTADADIVHVHLPDPLAVVSYLLSDPDPDALVVTYHSDIVKQQTLLTAYAPILRRFLDKADRILTTSPRLVESSPFLSERSDKCSVVPYGIDLDEFESYEDPSVDLSEIDGPVVLFVGRLVYYKGIEFLVEAMQDVDAHLLVVGDGQQRESLEQQARRQGVADRVSFLGEQVGDDLRYLYDRADVFALPSCAPSEAFAIVQLEAMAYGTPVVNTDLPTGVPWVSRDGETGSTVPHSDPGALASALNDLLTDTERREALGQAGRRRVEAEFTTDVMVSNVREIYEQFGH